MMLKTIYLLRHAKSSWQDQEAEDLDRRLSKRGREAANAMANYLAKHGIVPAQILCSPALRTRETLERMEKKLDAAIPIRFEKGIYNAEAPALLRRLRRLSDALPSVMIVGHNPGMERLALMLTGDGEATARNKLANKYPTGTLAILTAPIDHWRDLGPERARLEVFVRPKDVSAA
jgi:phosphohistidine phosphatase